MSSVTEADGTNKPRDRNREAFDEALTAARVVLNFRREEIEAITAALFDESERRVYFSHIDPRRVFQEIKSRLDSSAARAHRVQIQTPKLRVELLRDGDSNVIELQKSFFHFDGYDIRARVLRKSEIRGRIKDEAKRRLRDLTVHPIANDTDAKSDEIRMSRRMSRRMAMKGRLARIMAESEAAR